MLAECECMQAASEQLECELCETKKSCSIRKAAASNKKLRILCLHGFRQSAETFKAKLAKLIEETNDIAEYVFLDAPHTLPFLYRPRVNQGRQSAKCLYTVRTLHLATDFKAVSIVQA